MIGGFEPSQSIAGEETDVRIGILQSPPQDRLYLCCPHADVSQGHHCRLTKIRLRVVGSLNQFFQSRFRHPSKMSESFNHSRADTELFLSQGGRETWDALGSESGQATDCLSTFRLAFDTAHYGIEGGQSVGAKACQRFQGGHADKRTGIIEGGYQRRQRVLSPRRQIANLLGSQNGLSVDLGSRFPHGRRSIGQRRTPATARDGQRH